MNPTETFVLGLLAGLVVVSLLGEYAAVSHFKANRELKRTLEVSEWSREQAEGKLAECASNSEADGLIADEAKALYLAWFKSKRSLRHTNIVEVSVIHGIERLGALIIAVKGIHEVSQAFADAKNDGLPHFTRKLERVHENGEVFLREIEA